jgi:hypothetical protein
MKRKLKNQSRTPTPQFVGTSTTTTGYPVKEVDDYNADMVRGILMYFRIPEQEFNEWIVGQTCPLLPDGNIGFFAWDVHRFVDWKVHGIKPIWD